MLFHEATARALADNGVTTVFGVLVYPLWNGLQASTKFYRYGKAVSDIGLDNYRRLWSDPEFLDALWITVRFVTISVAIETVLGFALALFCAREFAGIRLLRTILIVPMVITPVVVAIVFRLIYANDAGMLTALITSGVHAEALAEARDLAAAIRDLAGDLKRMPDWAIPRLTW